MIDSGGVMPDSWRMSIQPVTGQGWIPSDETFGARLALVRQRMGWGNVKEAAIACGVPSGSWRNWEKDGRLPRDLARIAALIAERTGVDFDWLIRGRIGSSGGGVPAPGGGAALQPTAPLSVTDQEKLSYLVTAA